MDLHDMPLLETNRMQLRAMTPEIYRDIMTSCSEDRISTLLGLESAEALETEKQRFQEGLTSYQKSFHYFLLVWKQESKVIGSCGFHTWYLAHARAELGYRMFDEDLMGRGLMSEALLPIIRYGFDQMALNRIEAFVGTGNLASRKLLLKMGFREEGLLREHYCKNGQRVDSLVFSLLKTDVSAGSMKQ